MLLQMATGAGKTFTACLLIRAAVENGRPVLFAAHREELIHQARDVMVEDAGIDARNVGVILSGYQENRRALVQVGSIQTLSNRVLPPMDLGFIDEAHRSAGSQYVRLFKHYEGKPFIGLTATPWRLDNKPLSEFYDVMIEGPLPSELVRLGYLSDPEVYAEPLPEFEGEVGIKDGDFEERSLEKIVMRPELVGRIVPHYELYGGGQRAFCFAVSVAHARQIAYAFQGRGHSAEVLSGETPRADRRELLAAFARGELRILISVGVLLEGVDCPAAKVAIWARPTLSVTVYLQGTGRILRPWGGITPVVLDHAGNVDRLGMPLAKRAWSLTTAPRREGMMGGALMKECANCGAEAACGKRVCGECGMLFRDGPGEIGESDEELQRRRVLTPDEIYREVFVRHWAVAKKQGFRPGYVYVQTMKETGLAPPREWLSAVEKDAKNDARWKRAMGIKFAMKAKMRRRGRVT